MQGLLGETIENYSNISSRLANHSGLGTSAAYEESNDILFSLILGADVSIPTLRTHGAA